MSELLSIIIPVYNSKDSLFELYQQLKNTAEVNNLKFELILVDDNSLDNSYQQILKLHQEDKRVKGIRLAQNFGQQNAIFCAFNYARGDYIITMDDDLQHQAEDIIKLYSKIKEGYDAVYAIPKRRDYTLYRKIGSKLTNSLFNLISSKEEEIKVSSFRIITSKLMKEIMKVDKSFIYLSAIILQNKAKVANVYIKEEKRKYGESNYNFLKLLKLFFNLYLYYGNFFLLKHFRNKNNQYQIAESTFDS